MKILDKYILKKFLISFFFVVVILCTVICVIDFTEKNDNFIKTKPGFERILFDYYFNFYPYIANMLSPITVFIATVFVTAQLAAKTEIIAILSSGISFIRLLVPYIIGSAIIGLGTFFLIGWVIPKANKERVAFEVKYLKNPFYFDGHNVHIKVGQNTYAYLESYNNSVRTGYQFTLETIIDTQLKSKLKADRIVWDSTSAKWRIENYTIHQFLDNNKENYSAGISIDTMLNLLPKDFESNYLLYETFTTPELNNYIAQMHSRGADNIIPYQIERYLRTTYPFAIIILTIMGVIVSARKSRQGTGFQIALGFMLAFVYIIFFIMSRSIAQAGSIDPLLACWLPNIIFSGIALALYKTLPR